MDLLDKDKQFVFQNYTRQPIVLVRGQGALVWDIDGKEYIDCVAGIAVNNVGHCHPRVVRAIKDQAEKLMHTSNLYYTEPQIQLAEKIADVSGMDKTFFCNSGTEAVEAALKLARKATGRKNFIAAENAFHGRTMGSLSLTYNEKYREPFNPLVPGVSFVPYDNADALRKQVDSDTAAVVLEPIQAESGGIRIPSDDYLAQVREICTERDVLMILDEVQTGFARTGEWFGKDHAVVQPDIMVMAKALGGGFPIGAMAALNEVAEHLEPGDHAATFGGNPLACAAALASIEVIEDEGLVKHAAEMGEYFMNNLRMLQTDYIVEIRGKGLMIGMEVNQPGENFVNDFREKGVLINCIGENVLRFVPPLVITRDQIDQVVSLFG